MTAKTARSDYDKYKAKHDLNSKYEYENGFGRARSEFMKYPGNFNGVPESAQPDDKPKLPYFFSEVTPRMDPKNENVRVTDLRWRNHHGKSTKATEESAYIQQISSKYPGESFVHSAHTPNKWKTNASHTVSEPNVTNHLYSNKWGVPWKLSQLLQREWGGLLFYSGSDVYPANFPEDSQIQGAFAIKTTSHNLILNPPFDDIIRHIHHWLKIALKTSKAYIIIAPVRHNNIEFRQILKLKCVTTIFLKNRISFRDLRHNSKHKGLCPSKICIMFLNISGNNIEVDNTTDGVFQIPSKWKSTLQAFPSEIATSLPWAKAKDVVENYSSREQKAFEQCTQTLSFDDLLPSVTSTLDTKPFTPFSPLWDHKLSPLLTQDYHANYTKRKRQKMSLSRSEHLLKKAKGKFLPPTMIYCTLCHSNTHPTHACFLRIPSCNDLGIINRDDRHMHRFLTQNYPFFSEIPLPPGEEVETRATRIRDLVEIRKKAFRTRANKFFSEQNPPVSFRWHRPSFSQMRNNLDHHASLGKPLWILIQIAFGIKYPLLRTPPFRTIGNNHHEIDLDCWEIVQKRIRLGVFPICPNDFPDNISPIFGRFSSEKIRLLHNVRWINGHTADFQFQQETLDDFLTNLEPGDLLFWEDMKSCFLQFDVCPADRRKFGFQFLREGRLYTIIPTYALFGAALNPFMVRERFKIEIRLIRSVSKNALLWVDDLNVIFPSFFTHRQIDCSRHFTKWILEGGGGMFSDKGGQWIPRPAISTLGKNVMAPFALQMIPSKKIQNLLELCQEILDSERTTLKKLATIAGKFINYGPPISKLFTTKLYQIITHHIIVLTNKAQASVNKGSFHPKNPQTIPVNFDLHNVESNNFRTIPLAKQHPQYIYQKEVAKKLDSINISVAFTTQGCQQNPEFTKDIYRKDFATPPDLEPVFSGWFQTLKMQNAFQNKAIPVDWVRAYFVSTDASELGAGYHILIQTNKEPQSTKRIISNFAPFPSELRTIITTEGVTLTRASCARESFGVWRALEHLASYLHQRNLKPLPTFIYTDSLGLAFMMQDCQAKNHTTNKYITASLVILSKFNVPWEIFWKPRSTLSARSADLASKLPPWKLTEFSITELQKSFPHVQIDPIYPLTPLDFLDMQRGIPPPKLNQLLTSPRGKINTIILTPDLPKQTYRKALECLLQFPLEALLIVPQMKYKSWYSTLLETVGPPVFLQPTPKNFRSEQFQSAKTYHFSMACFTVQL